MMIKQKLNSISYEINNIQHIIKYIYRIIRAYEYEYIYKSNKWNKNKINYLKQIQQIQANLLLFFLI